MHRLTLAILAALLALALLGAPARAAEPETVARFTAEVQRDCRSAGGKPSLSREYQTTADLNADGQPDYVLDLTDLNCQGAESFFCGSAGCPLHVFLSGPGGYRSAFSGHVQAWSLEQGSPPVLVLNLHGGACGRAGVEGCESRLRWNGRELAAATGRGATPAPQRPAPRQPAPPAAAAMPAWALRPVAGASPVAVVEGTGAIRNIALLCHQGRAVAAMTLHQPPRATTLVLSATDGRQRVELPFRQQPGGGAAWYADLSGSGLPGLLMARDAALALALNGGAQGGLSRQGAAAAVRRALGPCLPLR